jgi:indolepyruvate ferredoxin oxidoreductase, alpha subunit
VGQTALEKDLKRDIAKELLLGNAALARGLVENGCRMAAAYPGTPSSEILSSVAALKTAEGLEMHVQWAINEKVAFEIAYAGAISGLRTAVAMKQVGLNVASDPLMSAAYMGTKGGFIVISADDPGPHSSQTEQDSRLMAMMAKIPVLDPASPAQALEMTGLAYELSETFRIPVMIRPTTRVCHARQDAPLGPVPRERGTVAFDKDPSRWAATPRFRFQLHGELEEKLKAIADYGPTAPVLLNDGAEGNKAVLVSGVAAAHIPEILREMGLWDRLPLYQVIQPFPLHDAVTTHVLDRYEEILVVEETMGVIEMQMADRRKVRGKLTGHVDRVGELLPERIGEILGDFAGQAPASIPMPSAPGRRPTLCAGCPHRASFFAIKKAAPRGIYTSDIGCYTLGLNLGAVDTVLCMGAAISQAAGFYHAHKTEAKRPDIVATMGDSTFFHAGVPALIDAVVQNVRFVLVILDNRTTAMTGNQPTPASGFGAVGEPLARLDIGTLVQGCGVDFCETADPYGLDDFIALLRRAVAHTRADDGGPAVVIARHPCLIDRRGGAAAHDVVRVAVTDDCDGCGYCVSHFECPALSLDEAEEHVRLDKALCNGCGVCVSVCTKGAIVDSE